MFKTSEAVVCTAKKLVQIAELYFGAEALEVVWEGRFLEVLQLGYKEKFLHAALLGAYLHEVSLISFFTILLTHRKKLFELQSVDDCTAVVAEFARM